MRKYRFIIVGSGWRSLFYVRVAKALPEMFEVGAMLCRTKEKAERMAQENDIYTTTSVEECREMKPDFVVVAVNKGAIATVSKAWMDYGFTVLCETPAAQDVDTLKELWQLHKEGGRIVVAEQYKYDALYQTQLRILERGLIGEPSFLHISLAHEYHGASLMRAYLKESCQGAFTVSAKSYVFPTVETLNRYEKIKDGRVADKKRTIATFEFADGKVALYEFDSEQYHSPIRNNYVKLQGVRGEMKDNVFFWLDEENELRQFKRLLTGRPGYSWLKIVNDPANETDYYYRAQVSRIEYERLGYKVIGYDVTFTCDGGRAYSEEQTTTISAKANTPFYVFSNSDDLFDYERPVITITTATAGTLTLKNKTDSWTTTMNNMNAGETLTIDSKNELLKSSRTRQYILNDFDGLKWPRLLPGKNEYVCNRNATITFTYRASRKVGFVTC